jgi:hypothetical protein
MMDGDGWSRLDPTYVTWFDYRLSLLWGAPKKGCRKPACIGVTHRDDPTTKHKKEGERKMKNDNLGRDEKKHMAKKWDIGKK